MIRFEYDKYDNQEQIDVIKLEKFLQEVWKNTSALLNTDEPENEIDNENVKQPYLKIQDGKFKPRNFIGFIYFEGKTIEIYPKVFKENWNDDNKNTVFANILHWLKYYTHFKMPHLTASLDEIEFDSFIELFLYLVTQFIHETISKHPYYQFKEKRETLYTPRGRIDFNDYVTRKLPYGKWDRFDCTYEPFIFDNRTNQVIKYTARLIDSVAGNETTKSLLREILFITDEVSDKICTVYDVDSIFVNPLFEEYETILYYCRMIIEQQVYSNASYEMKQFTFLLPMEKVFEDFVYGKMKEEMPRLERQKSNMYLAKIDNQDVFQMQHDIYLKNPAIIFDTKYKIRNKTEDSKRGVSQPDMYQLISYGFRRGITELYLFYPNVSDFADDEYNSMRSKFLVAGGFHGTELHITALNVPFWTMNEKPDKLLSEKYKEIAEKLMQVELVEA